MRIFIKILSLILISALILAFAVGCKNEREDEGEELPPVTTVGIPENEEVTSTLKSGGFTVNVYSTYSEIVTYEGEATDITVPDAFMGIPVKVIGAYAFYKNEKTEKVTLPSGLIVIGESAFQECSALNEVITGEHLEKIEQNAFRDSALEKIDLPDTVVTIERYSFYGTNLTSFTVPAGVSNIGKYALSGCERLEAVTLCKRLTRISEYVFYNCVSLKEIVITDNVEYIGDYAFRGCTSLEKIFIPKNTSLGENVLLGCPSVTIFSPKGSKAEATAKKNGYKHKNCSSAKEMTEGK